MATGIRRDWLHRVVNACQVFAGHAVLRRVRSLRSLFADFETQLPPPQSLIENVVLRGLLLELSLRWGHADHGAYHAEFPDAECTDDPSALAMAVWRNCPPDATSAFREWADAYVTNMERIHRVTVPTNFAGISMQISHSRYRFDGLHGNAASQSAVFSATSRS
jgi:hypothetical protein